MTERCSAKASDAAQQKNASAARPAYMTVEAKPSGSIRAPPQVSGIGVDRAPSDHLYWARTKSEGAAPPPKKLSEEEASKLKEANAAASGSAWNKASTWEEKPINTWACDFLKEQLGELVYELPAGPPPLRQVPANLSAEAEGWLAPSAGGATPELRVTARVLKAEKVSGEVTYVLSRGKQRVVFELELKLKLEMELRVVVGAPSSPAEEGGADGAAADGELKQILSGVVMVDEVCNDDLSGDKMPACKVLCDQGAAWKRLYESCAKNAWPQIKQRLELMVGEAKQKWR
jgi:hypothetical protein